MAGFRTKYEPPEIEEALIAAEGLTQDAEEQVEIAASLMGASLEEVRACRDQRKRPASRFTLTSTRGGGLRTAPEVVVIKRRPRAA